MAFTSIPFVVRTVQPVLEDLPAEVDEAAMTLGASDSLAFRRVILPYLWPALVTGTGLAFVRSLGEFGAVIFIAGGKPYETEITSLMIFVKLQEYAHVVTLFFVRPLAHSLYSSLMDVNVESENFHIDFKHFRERNSLLIILVLGEVVVTLGDAHLYSNHSDQVSTQLGRTPRALPSLEILRKPDSIYAYRFEDFQLTGYDPAPNIPAPVAI